MALIKPGIYPGQSNSFYHKSDGISKSGLDVIATANPAKYNFNKENRSDKIPTQAMIFGSLTHTLVFEPNQYGKEYIIEPEVNKRTNKGKADLLKFQQENTNKQIITQKDYDEAVLISNAVINHPRVGLILAKGEAETSLYATDDETGELVKVRPDWMSDDTIYDLKTCLNASPREFDKTIYNRRYHVQAGMYRHVANLAFKAAGLKQRIKNFVFIAVEKSEPYQVAVYVTGEETLAAGLYEYRTAMETYTHCMKTGNWYGYNEDLFAEINIPQWSLNRIIKGN